MTTNTIRRNSCITFRVTTNAGYADVPSRQWEGGARTVIKCRRLPGRCCVTGFAVSRKLGGCMSGICRSIVIGQMTTDTIRRSSCITFRVTTNAGYANVPSGQREGGTRTMIKCRRLPCSCSMTGFAVSRKFGR